MRKPAFCICEYKDADQLRCNCAADQRLCFRFMYCAIPLLSKSKISSLWPSSVTAQPGLCRTWSETPKTGFLTTRLILSTHKKVGDSTEIDTSNIENHKRSTVLERSEMNSRFEGGGGRFSRFNGYPKLSSFSGSNIYKLAKPYR